MTYFPAPGLVAGAAGLAVLSTLLIFEPRWWPIQVAGWALLLFLVAQDYLWLKRLHRAVTATLDAPSSTIRGESIPARLHVANDGDESLRVRVRPLLPERGRPNVWEIPLLLAPHTAQETECLIRAAKRGVHRFGDIHLRFMGRFWMLQGQRPIPASLTCNVYPDIQRVKEYILMRRLHHTVAPHLQTARLRGIGSEFESLRDYEEGDDIRRIDWKATAKHRKLITRNYEIEHFRDVMLVIDRGRLMAGRVQDGAKLDYALDAALMVAGVALDGGDRCGLLLFDHDVAAYLPPRSGMPQLTRLVETLFDVQPTLDESHFRRAFIYLQTRLTKRSLIVVLSDVVDVDASAAIIHGMLSLNRRHLVIFAALRTPEIEGVIRAPAQDTDAPFRKAVAYRLLRERAQVMTQMQKGGVHVLDLPPEEITLPVLNKYLELREMNLL
ncbi:MAG: DUF58 domain-containing protein [Candidatus Hydrogenedentes bacterium]|nr:DUF58 domain-containing protein [Candidatus Hydrogenedentota bacterium]